MWKRGNDIHRNKGGNMSQCLECGCDMVRNKRCPHNCEWCKDCDPAYSEETKQYIRELKCNREKKDVRN
jgi:hypothetical protein